MVATNAGGTKDRGIVDDVGTHNGVVVAGTVTGVGVCVVTGAGV